MLRDDRQLTGSGPAALNHSLDEFDALGVDVIQIMVNWNKIAPSPNSKKTPSTLIPGDPSTYPAKKWGPFDEAVKAIHARGMKVMLNPTGPNPRWASSDKNSKLWSIQPDAKKFATFARAVALRYNGNYGDSDGKGKLPNVTMWGIWNEPNVGGWLLQAKFNSLLGKTITASPHLYRNLYINGTRSIRSVGHIGDQFFVGDTSPLGFSRIGTKTPTRPAKFWREFFCLDSNYRSFKGFERVARGCPTNFKRIRAFAVAHHPYTRGGAKSPYAKERVGDLPIARTNALVALLNRVATKGRIGKRIPIWFTEYGLQTRPPDNYLSVNLQNQARFINEAEHLGYKNRRVKSYSQYEIVDDPLQLQYPKSSRLRYGGFQTGLKFEDLRHKPSYDAFRLPIVVTKVGGDNVRVWGAVRPKVRPTTVQIQAGSSGSFTTVSSVTVSSTSGYFEEDVDLSGAAGKNWRLSWTDSKGVSHLSRTAKATSR